MIDCHAHLACSQFDSDRQQVIARARKAGVKRIALVGENLQENNKILHMARENNIYLAFLGLHPDLMADDLPDFHISEVEKTAALIRQRKEQITGIGEVGLDFWVAKNPAKRRAQREVFEIMIDLALECGLALNVHSRSAGHYAIDLLLEKNRRASRVLMHAFDGKASHALRGAEAGFVFSIPPSIVRSEQKRKLVRALPLEALALETDSPVLGPEKGVRNEPANLTVSLEAIADIKGITPEKLLEITRENTLKLFALE